VDIEQRCDGIDRLSRFTRRLAADGIATREAYKRWRSDEGNATIMADLFGYDRQPGMPAITALVGIDFHPELDLVMYNYTGVAHNVLYRFPDGWVPTLRLCRGIVFSRTGRLVAHPFPKFFNCGEHPETVDLPSDVPWTATEKMDGHLGILFYWRGAWRATTRGSFTSPSAQLCATIMRRDRLRGRWHRWISTDLTILVEIVDPETRVHLDYGGRSELVLIGAYDRATLDDFQLERLARLRRMLGLPAAEHHDGHDLDELKVLMQDRSVRGREGLVVRFDNGLRVKFKFTSYLGLMAAAKLSPKYLMLRVMAGKAEETVANLDFEVRAMANEMLASILRVRDMHGDAKARAKYLHGLVPPEECTAYYKSICRQFVRHLSKT
jgi:RNA ligase